MPTDRVRPQRARNATLRDVAGRAEVSVATASRVLAGDYPVADATRERVMQAVQDLAYTAPPPRSVPRRRARMVAIIAEDLTIPMVVLTSAGIEEAAAQSGRLCLASAVHGDLDRELELVELLRDQRNVDAVILIGGVRESEEYRKRMRHYAQDLAMSGSRLVLCGRPPLGPDTPAVVVQYDNIGGAYAATSHLLSFGHRRIAMIAGEPGNSTCEQRSEGYRQALHDYGIAVDPALVEDSRYDRASGYTATKRLLDAGAPFTAIFAQNDLVASGALVALRERGRRVPQDVSLVGYDNTPVAQELFPALTTVNLPFEELGRTAVRLALANPQPGSGRDQVTLATHVVLRDSVHRIQPGR